ncbi:DUF4190 domain-containing protein [Microbacterium sp. NPDC089695]|uniref:DUF4190 domain-containing protein n=1 Tax=Microbacterium sp. NPDC089695 TaxID=3364198 RepID=UPI0037F76277
MSDNSIPTSSDGQQPTPPPAAPPYPHYPTAAYPSAASPAYPQSPQTQAYPGAAPTPAPNAYAQPHGAPLAQPAYGAAAPAHQPGGYPAYPAASYPASRPSSGLAITSLICGIAGVVLFWALVPLLASIVAVITGHMALKQTKANPAIGGRGMALAGLIMGYVMVAFLAIGIVMLLVSFVVGFAALPFYFSS